MIRYFETLFQTLWMSAHWVLVYHSIQVPLNWVKKLCKLIVLLLMGTGMCSEMLTNLMDYWPANRSSQPKLLVIRFIFISGLKILILPSIPRKAFMPSNNCRKICYEISSDNQIYTTFDSLLGRNEALWLMDAVRGYVGDRWLVYPIPGPDSSWSQTYDP